MSAVPSGSGGALPSRSEIEDWPTQHLDDAAAQLRSLGSQSVTLFEQHRQNIAAPGGTTWEGDAKDAALDRVTTDTALVRRQTAVQGEAADIAENGGHDVRSAKRAVLDAIAEAEADGFRVGEDLSVSDTRKVDPDTLAARQTAATEHAEYIRWNAEQLAQADSLIGQRLQGKAVELEGIRFDGEGEGRDGEGTVQLVDNTVKRNPPGQPADDGKDEPGGKPEAAPDQAPGQVGPFPVPKSVEDAANKPGEQPEGKPPGTDGVEGTLDDLFNPDEAAPGKPGDGEPTGLPPALSQQPPQSALDQILNQHTGNGKGDGQDGRYTKAPLTAPIVAADPSVVDRQAARVEAARQALDAAQAKLDAPAGQTYMQGAGAGPGRDVTDPLSQGVFDARRELTEQTAILNDLNQARSEIGGQPVPVPALPENADVQAFPPEPSAFAEGSRALSEGSLGLIPDVAHDIDVFTNWSEHSVEDQAGAVLDVAGMAPIPGGKFVTEGIEHAVDAFNATRHLDDGLDAASAGAHHVPDAPQGSHTTGGDHTPDTSGSHGGGGSDADSAVTFGFEDASALLHSSEASGGHLIERHVGRTFDDLSARMEEYPRLGQVSTFASVDEAAAALSTALHHNKNVFDDWIADGARGKLELVAPFEGGSVLVRGSDSTVPGSSVKMVLKSDGSGGWYVLTGMVDS